MAKTMATQMAEVKKDIQYLTEITEKGFKAITHRQDIANGKVLKHETDITILKEQVSDQDRKFLSKEDFMKGEITNANNYLKYGLTIIGGIIIAITARFIIDKLLL